MKIYFSASISGGRKYLDIYKKIVAHLKQKEHEVLTEHIIVDHIFDLEKQWSPKEIFERDIQWLQECDVCRPKSRSLRPPSLIPEPL